MKTLDSKRALQAILAVALLSPSLSAYLAFHDLFWASQPRELFAHVGAFVYGIVAYLLIGALAWVGLRGPRPAARHEHGSSDERR